MASLMDGVHKSIETNITDIVNHANNVTINSIYEVNHSSFDGYQWIACLDSSTCLACAELDNQIFDLLPGMNIEHKGQTEVPVEPPLHPRCRCILVPVPEGMRDDPTQTQLNYEDWFKEQDRDTQIDILGPSRYKEFLNGMRVTAFAKDGRVLSLNELEILRTTRRALLQLSKSHGDTIEFVEVPNNDKDVRDKIIKELADRGIYADFNESAKETIDYIIELHDKIALDFPDISKVINEISYTSNKSILNDTQGSGYDVILELIKYNKTIFNSKENLLKYINQFSNWFASTKLNGQIAHEYGHAIEKLIINLYKNDKIVELTIRKLLIDNGFKYWKDIEKELSIYAGTSLEYHEVIAEAVSDFITNGNSARQISKVIYNKLIELYRGL